MDRHDAYRRLESEFVQRLGYSGRTEIPDDLIVKVVDFCDAYADELMTSYYVKSIISQFYRKRSIEGWLRLYHALANKLKRKRIFIGILEYYPSDAKACISRDVTCIKAIWSAIDDLDAGYEKSNLISQWSGSLTEELLKLAYQSAQAMQDDVFKARALGGIFPHMGTEARQVIFEYLCVQFNAGSAEAAYRLKFIFCVLDKAQRAKIIALHLDRPEWEWRTAYLIIRNAANIQQDEAVLLAGAARDFESDYLKNRCLLKLASYLPVAEIDALYRRFALDFSSLPISVERLHNFYHFSAVVGGAMDKDEVLTTALEKIQSFDDSEHEIYDQVKYGQLLFILPNLTAMHQTRALSIAESIRGGYGKSALAKVKRHFNNEYDHCVIRGAPVFY